MIIGCAPAISQISIHAPARGATFWLLSFRDGDIISIHAPARGATLRGLWRGTGSRYFNPRSREGSDDALLAECKDFIEISIHAPARGATAWQSFPHSLALISIHAPARGATRVVPHDIHVSEFQSTLPRGERRRVQFSELFQTYFNPRSREGSDPALALAKAAAHGFQSTLPRGERPMELHGRYA